MSVTQAQLPLSCGCIQLRHPFLVPKAQTVPNTPTAPPPPAPRQPTQRIKQPVHVNRPHVFVNAVLQPIMWAHSRQVSGAVCISDYD